MIPNIFLPEILTADLKRLILWLLERQPWVPDPLPDRRSRMVDRTPPAPPLSLAVCPSPQRRVDRVCAQSSGATFEA